MSIVSLSEVKQQLNIDEDYVDDDAELQDYVDAVTGVVEDYINKVLEQRTIVERATLYGARRFRLWSVPVLSLTSVVTLDGTLTWDVSGFDVEGETGLVDVVTGAGPLGRVKMTYQAGYAAGTVPARFKMGALDAIQDAWKDSQRGAAGISAVARASQEQVRQRLTYVLSYKAAAWLGRPAPIIG